MDCLVLPISTLLRRSSTSRFGYRHLTHDELFDAGTSSPMITVVVGKEKREFLVDPYVLEEDPFRILIETLRKEKKRGRREMIREEIQDKRVIFVDVDSILFEHMLWLMYNDCSSLFQLNLQEIIEFYAQEDLE